ncbi:MAG: ribonuclease HI [Oscillospiraceae bacterium]|nr:ribonuclease HI [Oscillospiraceae bacterium]
MKKVVIYTDGACSGNPGPGGWGAVLMYENAKKEVSGGSKETTNNIMEITAVVESLKLLKYPCEVEVYSDSAYVVNTFEKNWLEKWKKNGWKNSKKEDVKNKELWEKLDSLCQIHKVSFIKVKGHADNELNNRCDELARGAIG